MRLFVAFALCMGVFVSFSPSRAQSKCDGIEVGRPLTPFVIPGHEARYRARIDFLAHRFEEGGYKVVVLGDSIAQRWPHELLSHNLAGPVLNAGIGGDGAAQLLWRLDDWPVKGLKPDTVLLIIGTNDIVRNQSGCTVASNLHLIIEKLKQIWPGSRILLSSILPRGAHLANFRDQIVIANDWLLSRASTAGFTYLDLFTPIIKACGEQSDCEYLEREGDVHPTVSGYEILTKTTLGTIDLKGDTSKQ